MISGQTGHRKAVGEPAGLAELMVYSCELSAGFRRYVGYEDGGYLDALLQRHQSINHHFGFGSATIWCPCLRNS